MRCGLSLLLVCPCAFGLNPAFDISQYAHTSWRIRDGFTKGEINSIAQTPDGYLWLGTTFGLFRFDGVQRIAWDPPPDQQLPSHYISRLLAARDGTLWIGTRNGMASWKNSRLTQYPQLAGQVVAALSEDREGTVWAGSIGTPTGLLCAIRQQVAQCFGGDGKFGVGVLAVYEDRKGTLWAGSGLASPARKKNGIWRWKPGPPEFYAAEAGANGIQGISESEDGTLLFGAADSIERLINGKSQPYLFPGPSRQFFATSLLRDRDGGFWIGTSTLGLVHVHQGRTDVFGPSDGLSGEQISALFEDREGNIWVATLRGLDRFREFAVPTLSKAQGVAITVSGSVLATPDESIWLAGPTGFIRWNSRAVTVYHEHSAKAEPGIREIIGSGLPDHGIQSLLRDSRGRIWISTFGGVGYLENDRFILKKEIPSRHVYSLAEDRPGNLWMADQDLGLVRLHPDGRVEQTPWASLGHKDFGGPMAVDPARGGLWIGFSQGGAVYYADGQVRESFTAANGLGEGRVNDLTFDTGGRLWASTEHGLSHLINGHITTLTSKSGLPCDAVHWVAEDDGHSLWLNMPCGLVRIARAELDAWLANANHTANDHGS